MNALLLVAHGSRSQDSNEDIRRLAEKLAPRVARKFDYVSWAFLELASPSLDEAIEAAIDAAAARVVVMPYFLAAGKHVASDIPGVLQSKRAQHPDIAIELTSYFGAVDQIAGLLAELALTA